MASEDSTSLKIEVNVASATANATSKKNNPVAPDSPLLRPSTPQSPGSRRAREIQREARRARNFRDSLERSGSRSRAGTPARCSTPTTAASMTSTSSSSAVPGEMSFSIKPSLGGRKGWKIMPESGESSPDPELLQRVIDMIHEMEFSGRAVPERITLKV